MTRLRSSESTYRITVWVAKALLFLTTSLATAAAPGTITTVVGNGTSILAGGAVAVDKMGVVYFSSGSYYWNSISKMTPDGTISLVLGANSGSCPINLGDGGQAALACLWGITRNITVDGIGNLYIVDWPGVGKGSAIRKVSPAGIISTLIGPSTYGPDGYPGIPSVTATLGNGIDDTPRIAADAGGNLFISDSSKNIVYKFAGGALTVVAGGGSLSSGLGDGGPATSAVLSSPEGIAVDAGGNLYISDTGHNLIRKVSPTGVISTVAGNGVAGYSGDSGPATAASISTALIDFSGDVTVDPAGNLYFDDNTCFIRKVGPTGTISTLVGGSLLQVPSFTIGGVTYPATTMPSCGYSGDNGPAASAQLGQGGGLAVDSSGNLYIADIKNNTIRMVTSSNPGVPLTASPAQIALGADGYALAYDQGDGTVWGWGNDTSGQLGTGNRYRSMALGAFLPTTVTVFPPAQALGLAGATAVAAGNDHALALKSDGTVWSWGWSKYGQVGINDPCVTNAPPYSAVNDCPTPKQVTTLAGIVAIAAGGNSSYAVKSDGTVWAWGSNSSGQLGNGTTVDSAVPVQVSGLANAIAVAASGVYALALKSDGTVWAWGDNSSGQLGTGTNAASLVPVQVAGLSGVIALAARAGSSAALDSSGAVWVWGYNNGFLPLSGANASAAFCCWSPSKVAGIAGAKGIAIADDHVLALKTDGTVWSWGNNPYGSAAISSTTANTTPTQVAGLSGIVSVAAEHLASLAVAGDGSIWFWGSAFGAGGSLGQGLLGSVTPAKMANAPNVISANKLFTVTPSAGVGGSLIPSSPQTVAQGQTASFLVAPDSGYSVASISGCNGSANNTVPDSYTTGPISANCSITVSFQSAASAGAPGAPAIGTAVAGMGSATISFTAPADNGSAITGYTVISSPGGITATGPASPIIVSGLSNGTAYTFTVTATNAIGAGPASGASNSVVPIPTVILNSLSLSSGWNLAGNSSTAAFDVASVFGDPATVTSVWKWVPTKNVWAFYTPIQADGGAAYAASKGYDALTSIAGGEGFWVNANSAFNTRLASGSTISSTAFQAGKSNALLAGWNLIATGDGSTPSQFNIALSTTPPSPGMMPNNLVSLWAWDAVQSNWYFYAPSLDANGMLASYVASKNYLNFGTKPLGPAMGFWVNAPAAAAPTGSSTTTSTTTTSTTSTTTSTSTTTTLPVLVITPTPSASVADYTTTISGKETSEASFTLDAAHPNHLDPGDYIDVPAPTTIWAFTAAKYSVSIYLLDAANAQLFQNGATFNGQLLNFTGGGTGMNFVNVPAGRYWIGTVPGQASIDSSYSNPVFHEVAYYSLANWYENGNLALGTGAINPGGWKSRGVTIGSGDYRAYIETEGMGGTFAVMDAAQYASFQSANANGLAGGSYSYLYACGTAGGGAATEIECELKLPAGTYYLVYMNDQTSVMGGAANIQFYSPR